MNHIIYIRVFLLLSIILFSTQSYSQAQRKVLFEEGTNASCGPCAQNNPILTAFLLAHANEVEAIKYHASWPGIDPMYSANPTQNTERIVNYYNMGSSGVPYCNADGVIQDIWPFSNANFTNALNTRMAVPTPLSITVSDMRIAGDSIRSTIILNLLSGLPSGNYKLRVMAIEGRITYSSPPGTNGETVFEHVFRRAYPNTDGVAINTSAGTQQFVYTYKREPAWVDSAIYTIAFVQNDVNKEVINCAKNSTVIEGTNTYSSEIPGKSELKQNYPNPFNPSTVIEMLIPKSGYVSLKVYDAVGRETQTLVEGNHKAGTYKIYFSGEQLASGIYFYKLIAGDYISTKKMILIK